jgi:hypothetical protein
MQETVVYKGKTTKSIDHFIKDLGDSRKNACIKGILMAATLAGLLSQRRFLCRFMNIDATGVNTFLRN